MKKFNERRIWYFPCTNCSRGRAQSHKKKKAVAGLCRKCRKIQVPENQVPLFPETPEVITSKDLS